MLKKLILAAVVSGLAYSGFAQGTVAFSTRNSLNSTKCLRACTDTALTVGASGTGYYGQLYVADGSGVAASSLSAVGTALAFGTSASTAGYIYNTAQLQVTAGASGPVTFQIRAWDKNFATYELAVSGGGASGKSVTFTLTPTYGTDTPSTTAIASLGLANFYVGVPEPATIALGVIGAAALLLRRRK